MRKPPGTSYTPSISRAKEITNRLAAAVSRLLEKNFEMDINTAENILHDRGIAVVYDFLANAGGVIASYFEWLRNLAGRFRYEAESICNEPFDIGMMDPYITPEYKNRIQSILRAAESEEATRQWNYILRDIMFSAVNDDREFSMKNGISMKTSGFADAILRVLAASMSRMDSGDFSETWNSLTGESTRLLKQYFSHPEVRNFCPSVETLERLMS